MAHSFVLTAVPADPLNLAKGPAKVPLTVTNTTSRILDGRLELTPKGSVTEDWFSIEGKRERTFGPNGTDQFTIVIKPPETAEAGNQIIGVRVVAVNDPDGDFSEEQTIRFAVPAKIHEEEKGAGSKVKWWLIAAGAAAALVIAGVVTYLLIPGKVTMPDVVGKVFEEAAEHLSALKLEVAVLDHVGGDRENTVVAQKPLPGEKLAKGSKVEITREASFVEVPALLGMKEAAARSALEEKKLAVGPVSDRRQDPNDAGNVVEQSIEARKRVREGTAVSLTIEAPLRSVPRLVTLQAAEAVKKLTDLGLLPKVETRTQDPSKAGQIVEQKIPEGQIVQRGTEVGLVAEPGRIQVPNVTGLPLEQAQRRLTDLQLLSVVQPPQPSTIMAPGIVGVQNPPAETPVTAGTQVALTPIGESASVPRVFGLTEAAGRQEVMAAGLNPEVTYQYVKADPGSTIDRIVLQQPVEQKLVLKGSTVTLTVETGQGKVLVPLRLREAAIAPHFYK